MFSVTGLTSLLLSAIKLILFLYPLWLPILLGVIFWVVWVRYVRYLFFANLKYALLEVQLPKDIFKSPQAMELAMNVFFQLGGEGGYFSKYWEGKTRPWFSLEIVSLGGQLKFLIWTRTGLRNQIEAQIYAQYPDVIIKEIEDYTKPAVYDDVKTDIWATHYMLRKPSHFPIMTYVDYGLNFNPKEEEKIDPMSQMLEFMGAIKPQEQIWFQIIIRGHKKEKRGGFFSSATDWYAPAEEERKRLFQQIVDEGRSFAQTEIEQTLIKSFQRVTTKPAFDCGIRAVYYAPKEAFNKDTVGGLGNLMRPYSASNFFNTFDLKEKTDPNEPWQDFRSRKLRKLKRKLFDAYKRRMYFYDPYEYPSFVLNTEALATIYHFPGQTAATPGIPRITSRSGQAPSNLPI